MKINISNPTANFSYNNLTNYTVTMKAVCRKVTWKNIILTIQKMVRSIMGRITEAMRRKDVRRLIKVEGVRNPSEPISVSHYHQAWRFYWCYSSTEVRCLALLRIKFLDIATKLLSTLQTRNLLFLSLYYLVQDKCSESFPGSHPCPAQPLWWCRSAC